MTITTLKELDKLMLLCRKRGVKSIKIDNIEFYIDADEPQTKAQKQYHEAIAPDLFDPGQIQLPEQVDMPDSLTEDQMLFYSSAPSPGEQ